MWLHWIPYGKKIKSEGYFVKSVDLQLPGFSESEADEFNNDLTNPTFKELITISDKPFDEIYQYAADMEVRVYIYW